MYNFQTSGGKGVNSSIELSQWNGGWGKIEVGESIAGRKKVKMRTANFFVKG